MKADTISAADLADLRARFPRAFSPAPQDRLRFWGKIAAATALAVYCLYRFDFFTWMFVDGTLKFGEVVAAQMFPPTGWSNLPLFATVIGETIAMAFLGTLLGALFAFPLAFLASKNMTTFRPAQFGARRFADLLRSFDYLIWALIFVRAIGLGPMAGIMAIAIVETGTFIKLYSEAIENLDRKQIDAVRSSGGNGLHVVRFGVLPQVLPMMLSNTLYMFEHNVRSASILGIVGAGGVGFLLSDRLRAYELQEACFIIILVVLTVYAIDFLSKWLREKLIGDNARPPLIEDAAEAAARTAAQTGGKTAAKTA